MFRQASKRLLRDLVRTSESEMWTTTSNGSRASSSSSASTSGSASSSPSAGPVGSGSKHPSKNKSSALSHPNQSNIGDEHRAAERLAKLNAKGGVRLKEGGPVYTKEVAWDYFKDSPFIGAMSLVNPPTPERIRGLVIMERTGTVWTYIKKAGGYVAAIILAAWIAIYTPFFSSTQKLIRQIKNAKDVALLNLNLSRFAWMGPFDLYAVRIAHENGIDALISRVKPTQHPSTRVLALRALVSLARSDVGLEDLRADPVVFEVTERLLADPSYRSCDRYESGEKYVRIPYDVDEVDEQLQNEARRLAQALYDSSRNPRNTRQRLQAVPLFGWLYRPGSAGSGAF